MNFINGDKELSNPNIPKINEEIGIVRINNNGVFNKNTKLLEDISTLKKEALRREKTIISLLQENQDLQNKLKDLQNKLKDENLKSEKTIITLIQEKEDLQIKLRDKIKLIHSFAESASNARIGPSIKSITRLRKEFRNVDCNLSVWRSDVLTMTSLLEEIKADCNGCRSSFNKEREQYKREIESLTNELNGCKVNDGFVIQQLQHKVNAHAEEIKNLKSSQTGKPDAGKKNKAEKESRVNIMLPPTPDSCLTSFDNEEDSIYSPSNTLSTEVNQKSSKSDPKLSPIQKNLLSPKGKQLLLDHTIPQLPSKATSSTPKKSISPVGKQLSSISDEKISPYHTDFQKDLTNFKEQISSKSDNEIPSFHKNQVLPLHDVYILPLTGKTSTTHKNISPTKNKKILSSPHTKATDLFSELQLLETNSKESLETRKEFPIKNSIKDKQTDLKLKSNEVPTRINPLKKSVSNSNDSFIDNDIFGFISDDSEEENCGHSEEDSRVNINCTGNSLQTVTGKMDTDQTSMLINKPGDHTSLKVVYTEVKPNLRTPGSSPRSDDFDSICKHMHIPKLIEPAHISIPELETKIVVESKKISKALEEKAVGDSKITPEKPSNNQITTNKSVNLKPDTNAGSCLNSTHLKLGLSKSIFSPTKLESSDNLRNAYLSSKVDVKFQDIKCLLDDENKNAFSENEKPAVSYGKKFSNSKTSIFEISKESFSMDVGSKEVVEVKKDETSSSFVKSVTTSESSKEHSGESMIIDKIQKEYKNSGSEQYSSESTNISKIKEKTININQANSKIIIGDGNEENCNSKEEIDSLLDSYSALDIKIDETFVEELIDDNKPLDLSFNHINKSIPQEADLKNTDKLVSITLPHLNKIKQTHIVSPDTTTISPTANEKSRNKTESSINKNKYMPHPAKRIINDKSYVIDQNSINGIKENKPLVLDSLKNSEISNEKKSVTSGMKISLVSSNKRNKVTTRQKSNVLRLLNNSKSPETPQRSPEALKHYALRSPPINNSKSPETPQRSPGALKHYALRPSPPSGCLFKTKNSPKSPKNCNKNSPDYLNRIQKKSPKSKLSPELKSLKVHNVEQAPSQSSPRSPEGLHNYGLRLISVPNYSENKKKSPPLVHKHSVSPCQNNPMTNDSLSKPNKKQKSSPNNTKINLENPLTLQTSAMLSTKEIFLSSREARGLLPVEQPPEGKQPVPTNEILSITVPENDIVPLDFEDSSHSLNTFDGPLLIPFDKHISHISDQSILLLGNISSEENLKLPNGIVSLANRSNEDGWRIERKICNTYSRRKVLRAQRKQIPKPFNICIDTKEIDITASSITKKDVTINQDILFSKKFSEINFPGYNNDILIYKCRRNRKEPIVSNSGCFEKSGLQVNRRPILTKNMLLNQNIINAKLMAKMSDHNINPSFPASCQTKHEKTKKLSNNESVFDNNETIKKLDSTLYKPSSISSPSSSKIKLDNRESFEHLRMTEDNIFEETSTDTNLKEMHVINNKYGEALPYTPKQNDKDNNSELLNSIFETTPLYVLYSNRANENETIQPKTIIADFSGYKDSEYFKNLELQLDNMIKTKIENNEENLISAKRRKLDATNYKNSSDSTPLSRKLINYAAKDEVDTCLPNRKNLFKCSVKQKKSSFLKPNENILCKPVIETEKKPITNEKKENVISNPISSGVSNVMQRKRTSFSSTTPKTNLYDKTILVSPTRPSKVSLDQSIKLIKTMNDRLKKLPKPQIKNCSPKTSERKSCHKTTLVSPIGQLEVIMDSSLNIHKTGNLKKSPIPQTKTCSPTTSERKSFDKPVLVGPSRFSMVNPDQSVISSNTMTDHLKKSPIPQIKACSPTTSERKSFDKPVLVSPTRFSIVTPVQSVISSNTKTDNLKKSPIPQIKNCSPKTSERKSCHKTTLVSPTRQLEVIMDSSLNIDKTGHLEKSPIPQIKNCSPKTSERKSCHKTTLVSPTRQLEVIMDSSLNIDKTGHLEKSPIPQIINCSPTTSERKSCHKTTLVSPTGLSKVSLEQSRKFLKTVTDLLKKSPIPQIKNCSPKTSERKSFDKPVLVSPTRFSMVIPVQSVISSNTITDHLMKSPIPQIKNCSPTTSERKSCHKTTLVSPTRQLEVIMDSSLNIDKTGHLKKSPIPQIKACSPATSERKSFDKLVLVSPTRFSIVTPVQSVISSNTITDHLMKSPIPQIKNCSPTTSERKSCHKTTLVSPTRQLEVIMESSLNIDKTGHLKKSPILQIKACSPMTSERKSFDKPVLVSPTRFSMVTPVQSEISSNTMTDHLMKLPILQNKEDFEEPLLMNQDRTEEEKTMNCSSPKMNYEQVFDNKNDESKLNIEDSTDDEEQLVMDVDDGSPSHSEISQTAEYKDLTNITNESRTDSCFSTETLTSIKCDISYKTMTPNLLYYPTHPKPLPKAMYKYEEKLKSTNVDFSRPENVAQFSFYNSNNTSSDNINSSKLEKDNVTETNDVTSNEKQFLPKFYQESELSCNSSSLTNDVKLEKDNEVVENMFEFPRNISYEKQPLSAFVPKGEKIEMNGNILRTAFTTHASNLVQYATRNITEHRKPFSVLAAKTVKNVKTALAPLVSNDLVVKLEELSEIADALKDFDCLAIFKGITSVLDQKNKELDQIKDKTGCWLYNVGLYIRDLPNYKSPKVHPRCQAFVVLIKFIIDRKTEDPDAKREFINEFIGLIENSFFLQNKEDNSVHGSTALRMVFLGLLYTSLARLNGALVRVRRTMYDLLYCFTKMGQTLSYTILSTWPAVLPHKPIESYYGDPLALAVIHALTRNLGGLHDFIHKTRHLESLLWYSYKFNCSTTTNDQLFDMFMTRLCQKGVHEAMILLVKCQPAHSKWFKGRPLKALIDVVQQWRNRTGDDAEAAAAVNIIGCVCRTFNGALDDVELHPVFQLFREIISDNNTPVWMQEVIALNACRLARVQWIQCLNIILDMRTRDVSSEIIDRMIIEFISKRSKAFWTRHEGIQYLNKNSGFKVEKL